MGKGFHGLSLGLSSFKTHETRPKSPLTTAPATSPAGLISASPGSKGRQSPAPAQQVLPSAPPSHAGPLTLGKAHEQQHNQHQHHNHHLSYSAADVVLEEDAERLPGLPAAVLGGLQADTTSGSSSSSNGAAKHDLHGPQPAAQQQYGALAGKMLRMVNELRATGADVTLELPTIVVCGQQSAGKSSVVENICGIPLPRAADTCTRCPTEVRLSQAGPSSGSLWEATVKLRREHGHAAAAAPRALHHAASSGRAGSAPASPACGAPAGGRHYPCIAPADTAAVSAGDADAAAAAATAAAAEGVSFESVFRAGIHRPEDLAAAVTAAQACLLGPAVAAKRAVQHSSSLGHGGGGSPAVGGPDSMSLMAAAAAAAAAAAGGAAPGVAAGGACVGGLKFSRDVVVVEVAGAPVDLTLIDLPGIIQNVERPDDEHYKLLVAELAARYMRRPGTIIVAIITCTADIDTQGVLSMARAADPQGVRTLGVLTKPDQVEEGCHGQWLQVLQGSRYPLQLGWFVVKNPNQAALLRGTSGLTARQQEEAFFCEGAPGPWARLPADQRARLGTLRLREAMSRQLVKMTAAARPALMAAVQEQLVGIRAELAALPPAAALGDGHAELLRLIDDVSASIQEEILARSQSKAFYQHLTTLFQQFKSSLVASRPCFLLPRASNGAANGYLAVSCALDDDLAFGDEQQQAAVGPGAGGGASATAAADAVAAASAAAATPPAGARLGSYNIFGGGGSGGSGKPGLGVFITGSGSGSGGSATAPAAGAGHTAALVLAAGPHQVLLPPDSPEALRGLTLEDVRQAVELHHSIELPGFSPYSAVQELVSRHQTSWEAAAAGCVASAQRQLLQLVLLHVNHTCVRFPPAADHIRELATELLEELNSETTAAVDGLVAMELSGTLFAVSRREFSRASSQHLEGLRMLLASAAAVTAPTGAPAADAGAGGRAAVNVPAASPASAAPAVAGGVLHTGLYDLALAGHGLVLPPIPATATGTPELLNMMAAALAYYALACRRLSDTVSMGVMHYMVAAFTSRFRSRLAAALLSLSSESVASLLVEDEASAARRASLTARRDMLEAALKVMRAAV